MPVMKELQLREAETTLSAGVDVAERGGADHLTKHGRPAAVVISYKQWDKLNKVPSFADFSSPPGA